MKKSFQLIAVLVMFIAITAAGEKRTSTNSCVNKEAKTKAIDSLNTFYYASSKVTTIDYTYKTSVKEVEVPLFKGEKYRMVFNREDLPKNVEVEIYDKSWKDKGRSLLYSSKDQEPNTTILSYEPNRSRNLYINYIVPPAEGSKETGCIVFVLGYQLTFIKN
tara:strand:- start:141 stop:626 length:486 start_codon:yes stop_codon:yes gene_type:complete